MSEEGPKNRFEALRERRKKLRFRNRQAGLDILRRQASKKSDILSKYRENPILSTIVKSGESVKGLLFKASELERDHKLIMSGFKDEILRTEGNWFTRFLKRSRESLYDPNNDLMLAFENRLNYNQMKREIYYGD